jgi:Notch-like protein
LVPICFGINGLSNAACDYHGDCIFDIYGNPVCSCDTGYKIVDGHCLIMKCNGIPWDNTFVCSNNGDCKIPDEECNCAQSWTGSDCEKPICDAKTNDDPLVCNGRGICDAPNLCNCTDPDWYGNLCEQTDPGVVDPPTHKCRGENEISLYFYDQPQACGPNGWCVAEDTCLCKCLYYGDVCQYKYFDNNRVKYCHSMRLNDRFRTWRRYYEE